jgi:N-acetylglucosaminyldiphosphoundecaprenol N-acetyl-beta-D-mannosaminyltransferase
MTHLATSAPLTRPRIHLGALDIDDVSLAEALAAVSALVERGEGGTVLTPNVDHVVLVEDDARLRAAYAAASLSLVDGTPVLWASHLLGEPLREKVSGSDLILPLMELAAAMRYRVYFLGGGPGVAERAAARLGRLVPDLRVAGIDAPAIDLDGSFDEVVARIRAARPHLVLVALGCPKQEIFMHKIAAAVRPAVLLGIGAGLDFFAGTVERAPAWVSAAGLEWLYRLAREPRRLWRRYLVRDPRFLWILLRELRARSARRAAKA